MGVRRGAYRILGGSPEGRIPLRIYKHRWKDDIKMDHHYVRWGGMNWNPLAKDRDSCRPL